MSASSAFGLGMAGLNFGLSAAGVGKPSSSSLAVNPLHGAMGIQKQGVDMEVASQNAQADEALKEAGFEEQQKALEVSRFRENQALGYDSSGVLLEGSPLLVLNQTAALGRQEIDRMAARGQALAGLLRQKAYITSTTGEAQMLGEQDQFITQQAQARIAAAQASSGMLGNAFNGLIGAIGSALPSGGGSSGGNYLVGGTPGSIGGSPGGSFQIPISGF